MRKGLGMSFPAVVRLGPLSLIMCLPCDYCSLKYVFVLKMNWLSEDLLQTDNRAGIETHESTDEQLEQNMVRLTHGTRELEAWPAWWMPHVR